MFYRTDAIRGLEAQIWLLVRTITREEYPFTSLLVLPACLDQVGFFTGQALPAPQGPLLLLTDLALVVLRAHHADAQPDAVSLLLVVLLLERGL